MPPRHLCSSARSSATQERTMSDQDEALLDEDLGDEEYDLGNDEEEALLADDYEIDRQNSYKGEEETDDVLDLGVTDALDDLEGEDENIEYRSDTDNHNHSDFYKEERTANHGAYYDHEEHEDIREEHYEDGVLQSDSALQNSLNTVDLREKLQKNVQRKVFVGNGQGLEDDDCDEAEERRNRFQNERIMIPQKMNHEIPDSLENVVTVEQVRQQPSFRGHGRGRGMRGIRGGRFAVPNPQGNYMPRFNHNMRGQPMFNEQKQFRPPLLEGRPPMYPRVPSNNMMNQQQQQLMYQQNPPQLSPYMSNGPPQPSGPHFAEPRPPFNPNQFPGQGMPQGPRMIGGGGPRLEYRPRGAMQGPSMPRYNCPPGVPPYMQNQSQHFQPPMIPGNQGPSLLGNPNLPLPGNQGPPGLHGNPGGPQIPLNSGPPMQDNPGNVMMQNFSRIPGPPSQGPSGPNQPPFNNRPNFQEPSFEGRPMYDSRPMYNNQPQPQQPVSQMNNSALISPPQQTGPHVPNVPLPPGHKILINPHFRGAVQPTADARLAWDSQQQQQPPQHQQPPHQPPQHQLPQHQPSQHPPAAGEGFAQPPSSYQSQNPYGQPAAPPQQQQQNSQEYQQNYQSVKSDDPYAYFSDVWQENKTQKPSPTNKSYPPENNYSRDTYSNYGNKYGKSESNWDRDSYQEEQRGSSQTYRERDPPPRPRIDNVQRQRVTVSNNSYHNEPYDQKLTSRPMATAARPAARPPVKRSPESHERVQRTLSPKRAKVMSNRYEFRTTSSNENVSNKKEEDMDPEMREYRKKMEEQKRLREKILQEKENRRKQAAMEKMGDESRGDSRNEGAQQQQETKPVSVVTGVTKDNAHPMPARGRSRPANSQATEGPERAPGVRIVRAIQTVENQPAKEAIAPIANVQNSERGRPLTGQTVARRVVIHKPLPNTQKIATTVQKTVSNLQRAPVNARIMQNVPKGILKKQPAATGQKVIVNANRTIVQELPGQLRVNMKDVAKTNVQKVVVNTQNNQRVVLQKPTGQIKPRQPETKTNTVRIDNLAASTSESQIRRMCQGIGTLESIHMGEGNATIVFKTQSAALVFHKKYQRKMLDLSLINVHLVQPTSNN